MPLTDPSSPGIFLMLYHDSITALRLCGGLPKTSIAAAKFAVQKTSEMKKIGTLATIFKRAVYYSNIYQMAVVCKCLQQR